MRHHRGFTLVEVLVVIGMIGVLVAILLPSINRAREQALTTRCAANLHSNGQALINYALQNKSRLPSHPGGGRWLWDLPYATRDAMVKSGMSRASMYCPTYEDQDVDGLWNYEPFAVTGYFWLTERADGEYPGRQNAGGGATAPSPGGTTPAKTLVYHRRLVSARSTEIELATDATISNDNTDPRGRDGYFMNVKGGYKDPHDSSHVNGDDRPRGGNILYMDGHVAWRPFDEMVKRAELPEVEFWY